jgi:hypothetical protein
MNFLKKIFSPAILTISFLILIYTFYKSEIHWNGGRRDYFLIYYIISLLLIFLSIITFFINQKIKEYLIISSISIIVSLYLFEGYLIFKDQLSRQHFLKSIPFYDQLSKDQLLREQLYENQTGKKWDTRTKYEVYKDLKKVNDDIVMSVPPSSYLDKYKNKLTIPLSGISNSKTIQCNENGYYSINQSDRYGFNNPDEEWDKKEIEYFLIGDSFTQGDCVNIPNDIGSVLRTLSNKSVLNLGYGGNNPLIEFATIREYLNTNVKKVLWIYYESDLYGLEKELKYKTLMNYLNDLTFTQNLKTRQNEINDLTIKRIDELIEYKYLRYHFKWEEFIKFFNTRNLILKTLVPAQVLATDLAPEVSPDKVIPLMLMEFKKILKLTKDLTNKNNSKLYFVYLPTYSQFNEKYKFIHLYDSPEIKESVKDIVNELKIPFIDIAKEVFEKEQNPLKLFPFELHAHYNIEGYKKVSEVIYKLTKE